MKNTILLINCPDQKNIIATVTSFIAQNQGNITYLDQHVDAQQNVFFMRLECQWQSDAVQLDEIKQSFETQIAVPFQMDWKFFHDNNKLRMAIFVSKYDHCLYDILARHQSNELPVEIPLIISNHLDLKHVADRFSIPFYHIPFNKTIAIEAEKEQIELLKQHQIDFIVLARYMQIVGKELISLYPSQIINIHHSFLPAFPGAKPYHSAYERGVKIIGATSHYVTQELDEGPIIEQDITRVSHIDDIDRFISKGRDLERLVLARAIKLHCEHKTMVYNHKTVVFV